MADTFSESDWDIRGTVTADQVKSRGATLTSAMWSASTGDRLAAAKAVHSRSIQFTTIAGAAVATATWPLAALYGATTLISMKAWLKVAATGGDTVTIDLQRSASAGAFATVLSSALVLSAADPVALTLKSATISDTTLEANDLLQLVITVSGTSAQGLCVEIEHQQNPS